MRVLTSKGRRSRWLATAIVLVAGLVLAGKPHVSRAAFPGVNGVIAYPVSVSSNPQAGINIDIYAVDPATSDKVPLATSDLVEFQPRFEADGSIVYAQSSAPLTSQSQDVHSEIWRMNQDGTGKTQLTSGHSDFSPASSPNGSKIAFVRDGAGVVLADSDGSNITPLTNSIATGAATGLTFSPDGQRLLFTMPDGSSANDSEVYSVAINGTDLRQLTDDSVQEASADYSPGGARIAYATTDSSQPFLVYGIWTMKTDGTDQVEIAQGDSGGVFGPRVASPSFSPDGSRLTIESGGQIATMKTDGTQRVSVGANGAPSSWGPVDPNPGPPTAQISASSDEIVEGDTVSLDASESKGTPGHPIVGFEWDLDSNPGFEKDTGASPTVDQTYAQAGTYHPAVKVTGDSGQSATASTTIRVLPKSRPGPIGVSINAGAQYTNDPRVQISTRWPDGDDHMRISNDGGFVPSERKDVADFTSWKLDSSGPERLPKTVYVRFSHGSLESTTTFQDDIILDETNPVIESASTAGSPRAARPSARKNVTVKVKAKDKTSGVKRIQLANKKAHPGKWKKFRSKVAFNSKGPRVYVRVEDGAGNRSSWERAK